MSNNKQSSVDFLNMQLIKYGIITYQDLKQAKAMHKEEVMNAHEKGYDDGYSDNGNNPIDYYKETFETE